MGPQTLPWNPPANFGQVARWRFRLFATNCEPSENWYELLPIVSTFGQRGHLSPYPNVETCGSMASPLVRPSKKMLWRRAQQGAAPPSCHRAPPCSKKAPRPFSCCKLIQDLENGYCQELIAFILFLKRQTKATFHFLRQQEEISNVWWVGGLLIPTLRQFRRFSSFWFFHCPNFGFSKKVAQFLS